MGDGVMDEECIWTSIKKYKSIDYKPIIIGCNKAEAKDFVTSEIILGILFESIYKEKYYCPICGKKIKYIDGDK